MAFRPARSLLHPYPEPLPPYTPRQTGPFDPETSSINSNAPSYVSAAPSYHSGSHPINNRGSESGTLSNTNAARRNQTSSNALDSPSGLLSSQQYAPGFGGIAASSSSSNDDHRRTSHLTNSHLHSLYNVSDWVPVAGGLQARHYHNVAKRRASAASQYDNIARYIFPPVFHGISETGNGVNESDAASSSARASPPLGSTGRAGYSHRGSSTSILASLHEESVVHPRSQSPQQIASENNAGGEASQTDLAAQQPVSPHEDPDLVGEAAAAMFRSQRLYITYQQQENHSVEAQTVSSITGRPHQQAPAGRTHQYSSLIAPAGVATLSTPPQEQHSRPSTAPSAPTAVTTQPGHGTLSHQPQPQQPEIQTTTGRRNSQHQSTTTTSTTRQFLDDDALCAQESKTWDFMLAQMADWEERERSWKKFKDDMDKKLNSGKLGLGWGSWSLSTGGKGKLKKASHFGHEKKWKRKVGLAS